MAKTGGGRRALGALLVTAGVSALATYLWQFGAAVWRMDASELEASLQDRGTVFWLIFGPVLVPASVIFMYIMWIGYKMYIHSPEEDQENDKDR